MVKSTDFGWWSHHFWCNNPPFSMIKSLSHHIPSKKSPSERQHPVLLHLLRSPWISCPGRWKMAISYMAVSENRVQMIYIYIYAHMVLMFQSYMIIRLMVLMLIWTIDDNIWLVVKTLLKKMKVSCDNYSHVLWKITNVPNHQPDDIYTHCIYIYTYPPTWPVEILVEKMMMNHGILRYP